MKSQEKNEPESISLSESALLAIEMTKEGLQRILGGAQQLLYLAIVVEPFVDLSRLGLSGEGFNRLHRMVSLRAKFIQIGAKSNELVAQISCTIDSPRGETGWRKSQIGITVEEESGSIRGWWIPYREKGTADILGEPIKNQNQS